MAQFPEYDDELYGTVTLQQFVHSIGITLYEGMWMSRAYSLEHPAEIKENMYFAIETFAGHPGLPVGVETVGVGWPSSRSPDIATWWVALVSVRAPHRGASHRMVGRVCSAIQMFALPHAGSRSRNSITSNPWVWSSCSYSLRSRL